MPNVLIALPLYKREWILPYWLKAIEKQDFPLSNIGFAFELGPYDDETHQILFDWHAKHPEVLCFETHIENVTHTIHEEGTRKWVPRQYIKMAILRNNLLLRASEMRDKFDYMFSLDSDILLQDPQTINKLIAYSEQNPNHVVSPLMWMTPNKTCVDKRTGAVLPSCSIMSWEDKPGQTAMRRTDYPLGKPFVADIVMAAVLIPRDIFISRVKYRAHIQGEDLGFASQLYRYGFKSLAATDIECPHIMHKFMLDDHVHSWLKLEDEHEYFYTP